MVIDEFEQAKISEGVVAFLLFGLISDWKLFRDCSIDGLRALAGSVAADLAVAAKHANLPPLRRKRVAEFVVTLAKYPPTTDNPIPHVFKAMLGMVRAEPDPEVVIRSLGTVCEFLPARAVGSVLIDTLWEHRWDLKYADRLIDAAATVSDSLNEYHYELLHWISQIGSLPVAWRARKLLDRMRERNGFTISPAFGQRFRLGIPLLDWLMDDDDFYAGATIDDRMWWTLRTFQFQPKHFNECDAVRLGVRSTIGNLRVEKAFGP